MLVGLFFGGWFGLCVLRLVVFLGWLGVLLFGWVGVVVCFGGVVGGGVGVVGVGLVVVFVFCCVVFCGFVGVLLGLCLLFCLGGAVGLVLWVEGWLAELVVLFAVAAGLFFIAGVPSILERAQLGMVGSR
ncbi:hypothetical protein RA261_27350, partial [Pseudomonas syringae pv. tagetis]